jgi:FkbM family methyltransferase
MEHISNKNAFEHRMLFALTPAPQYCLDPLGLTRTYVLSGAAGELRIELPQLHPWPEYITQIPLYDRFFPFLCAKIGEGTIIDIGANIGDTVCMLRSFGASQRIIAVEPDIEFHELLQRNINRNSLQNVDTYQYAISSTPQRVKLSKDNRLSTANVELIKSTGKSQPDNKTLETRTFADIVKDFHLSAEEIKVIKIDTDGFDWDVLQSVSDWLVESPNNNLELPIIFYEHQTYLTSKGSSDNNRENQENLFLRALQQLRTHGYLYYVIFDNFGTMIIKTSDFSELAELSKYPRRSELMNRRTTIHYYDVLAYTDKSTAFVDKVTCEYLDNPSIPDGGQRGSGQPKIYLKAGE